jgi:hypothetical protein
MGCNLAAAMVTYPNNRSVEFSDRSRWSCTSVEGKASFEHAIVAYYVRINSSVGAATQINCVPFQH